MQATQSLYGLKQSPRAWFGKFSHIVQLFGLKRSEADHSVFYCHTSLGKCVSGHYWYFIKIPTT